MSVDPKIDQIFEQWNRNDCPGMAIAVTKNGKLHHRKAYGMADLDQGIPNKPDTVFHCASVAKQFTAMSVLLLSDEIAKGKKLISLDDDVRKHIPELKIRNITIRQLLHHTSGLRDMLIQLTMGGWRWGDDAMTRDDVLGLVSRMETPNFTPGSKYAYSNTNYFLAGEIVERVSKKSLAEFAHENIFDPLKMTSTRFVNTYCETVRNRAYGYRPSKRVSGAPFFEKRMPNYDLTGPTNLFTTVGDLMLWDENFDSNLVGGADGVAALQRSLPESNAYGLGLIVLRDGDNGPPRKIYHNGRTIGHRAHLFRDYERRISIALLCNVEFTNVEATDDLVLAVSEVVEGREPPRPILEQAAEPVPPNTRGAVALAEYPGTYYSSEIDTEYEVKKQGASLVIKRPRHPDCPLVDFPDFPDDKFVARNFTEVLREVEVTFLRNGNNDVTELQLDWSDRLGGSRLKDFHFIKQ